MDYFNNVLATFFWALIVVVTLLSERNRELSEFIKNILICVLKMNEGLTEGE